MLQPEKDDLQPHAANGTSSSNGYPPSEEASHFADPSGGLSSSGMAPLQHQSTLHVLSGSMRVSRHCKPGYDQVAFT